MCGSGASGGAARAARSRLPAFYVMLCYSILQYVYISRERDIKYIYIYILYNVLVDVTYSM